MNIPTQIKNYFSYLESEDTRLQLSLVNSYVSFVSKITFSNEFLFAKDILTVDPNLYAPLIIERGKTLLDSETNPNFRHLYDSALAGYILLLSETSLEHTQQLLEKIVEKSLPNLWWTNAVGNNVIRSKSMMSVNNITNKVLSTDISSAIKLENNDTPQRDIDETVFYNIKFI